MKKAWRVEIVWRDSMLDNGGWLTIKRHLRPRWGQLIRSVGFVLQDNKKGISLASSVHNNKAAGVIHIPAGCIVRRRRLR